MTAWYSPALYCKEAQLPKKFIFLPGFPRCFHNIIYHYDVWHAYPIIMDVVMLQLHIHSWIVILLLQRCHILKGMNFLRQLHLNHIYHIEEWKKILQIIKMNKHIWLTSLILLVVNKSQLKPMDESNNPSCAISNKLFCYILFTSYSIW